MDAQECLQILRRIKDVAFATVDERGKPKVRMIDVMLAEEGKLFFCTARGKDFYRQVKYKKEVAVTGMNEEFQMIRLEGKADRVEEQKLCIDHIFEANPMMNDVYPGNSRYILEAFCVRNGDLEFFDLGKTPIYRETFTLGDSKMKQKGFFITDACINCHICSEGCPQQCIKSEEVHYIMQEHCLHCGWCYENCPVQAVMRRG